MDLGDATHQLCSAELPAGDQGHCWKKPSAPHRQTDTRQSLRLLRLPLRLCLTVSAAVSAAGTCYYVGCCSGSALRCDSTKYRVFTYLAAFRLQELSWDAFRCVRVGVCVGEGG